ncbi:hypothetical protein GCM10025857_15680 [Alicyclobacillus contaminans]|nr:hypothetical protein GCM10025857_15680 [Alicyclobacillus contaminans]
MAMILAGASLLAYHDNRQAQAVSRAIYEATLEAVVGGARTADLGGGTSTTDFTDAVIQRVKTKLEVWTTLGELTE